MVQNDQGGKDRDTIETGNDDWHGACCDCRAQPAVAQGPSSRQVRIIMGTNTVNIWGFTRDHSTWLSSVKPSLWSEDFLVPRLLFKALLGAKLQHCYVSLECSLTTVRVQCRGMVRFCLQDHAGDLLKYVAQRSRSVSLRQWAA